MTETLYYEEPYRKDCEAKILQIEDGRLILDSTVFYPEGGGQPGDVGYINNIKVTDTRKGPEGILHLVEDTSSFSVGQTVQLSLDWQHRYNYMRAHSAEHMLAGTLYTLLGINTLAIHLSKDFVTIECDRKQIRDEEMLRVEDEVNRKINENRNINYLVLSREEAEKRNLRRSIKVEEETIRLVEIEGVDLIACGGLHVKTTGEVGEVIYGGCESIRGHERMIWYFGDGAIAKRREDDAVSKEASVLLSARGKEIPKAIRRLIDEEKRLKAKIRMLDEMVAASTLEKSGKVFISPVPVISYTKLCRDEKTFFTVSEDEAGAVKWLLGGKPEDFERLKTLYGEYKMKGGGRAPLWQGSAECRSDELLCAVEKVL